MTATITVAPKTQKEGCDVEVRLTGGTPGDTVTVNISNNGGGSDSVQVQLDSSGNGSTRWTIPAGWAASNGADFDSAGWVGDTLTIEDPGGDCYPIPTD